jgi:hypothetical protein
MAGNVFITRTFAIGNLDAKEHRQFQSIAAAFCKFWQYLWPKYLTEKETE